MAHVMKILDLSGHRTLMWDESDTKVREEFDDLIKRGWHAAVTVDGTAEKTTVFNPEASEILIWPQFEGG